MNFLVKTAIVFMLFTVVFRVINGVPVTTEDIKFSTLVYDIEQDQIKTITIKQDGSIEGEYKQNRGAIRYFRSNGDINNPEIYHMLLSHHVVPDYEKHTTSFFAVILGFLPTILLIGVVLYAINKTMPAEKGGIKKSHIHRVTKSPVRFDDVAGCEEAKQDLLEVVEYLKEPKKFTAMGARIPRGVLLEGGPGLGKTMLAKAVAGEAGVPFFISSGSEFVEMYVGVGASRVRELFEIAKKHSPCIVFIDEIDAVGQKRSPGGIGGHGERDQTLNQILVEMDGFKTDSGVIIMAATNRADVLDPALLRPGRFDRKISLSNPDLSAREKILTVHAKDKPMDSTVDLAVVARGTPGFSGAELENLLNESAILAVKDKTATILPKHIEIARDKILMGVERRTLKFSDEERKSTAYHEAGHTLVAKLLPGLDPIHKVTIVPRGRALGVTQTLPIDDKVSMSKDLAEKTISFLMGGRVAEEIVLGQITSGASNDIERASAIAEHMVCDWGMSDLGPIKYKKKSSSVQLTIADIIDSNYTITKKLLEQNLDKLHALAQALLDKETLTGEEVSTIIGETK